MHSLTISVYIVLSVHRLTLHSHNTSVYKVSAEIFRIQANKTHRCSSNALTMNPPFTGLLGV